MAKRIREKAAKRIINKDNRPSAIAKFVRISSSKVCIVMDLVRGKSYREACAILENTPKAASPLIKKVMDSAAANAENNLSLNKDKLFVAECHADPGPTLKRMDIRARGRSNRLLLRTSHITVVLDTIKE
ncbi:MAG: 50S ribosomal protein L22 [Clostridia bacterium]|jgi:large subunit ribosomal protein L22|nr:50S ribosomal protein L22 [Clostridia bacterium]MDD4275576.1 50S ribosomal protein L22 [Clostridia bacterium]